MSLILVDEVIAAIDNDDLLTVQDIILKRGLDVNSRNSLGFTPLTWASFKGRNQIALFLLRQGAKKKASALQIAIQKNNVELIKFCILNGANPKKVAQYGVSSYELADTFGINLRQIINEVRPRTPEEPKKKKGFWSNLFGNNKKKEQLQIPIEKHHVKTNGSMLDETTTTSTLTVNDTVSELSSEDMTTISPSYSLPPVNNTKFVEFM
ncbi:hypothetical protein ABK040_003706 [Willaertia magna]